VTMSEVTGAGGTSAVVAAIAVGLEYSTGAVLSAKRAYAYSLEGLSPESGVARGRGSEVGNKGAGGRRRRRSGS